MKRTVFCYFLLIALCCSQIACTQTSVNTITIEQFKELYSKQGGVILDVRTPEEVSQGIIGGASVINFYDTDFKQKALMIEKSKPVYVYCKVGGRSKDAALILAKSGFKEVYNIDGGIMAWVRAGNKIEKSADFPATEVAVQFKEGEFDKLLSDNQLVLVDFNAKWCAPCKRMLPVIDEISSAFKGKVLVLKIDVDREKLLSQKLEIEAIPLFIIYKNAKEIWRHNGTIEKAELTKILEQNI